MRLQTNGQLLDDDNLGIIPTYTLATFIYNSKATYNAQRADKIVLQRMHLDVPKAGWYQSKDRQDNVSPDDPILAQFKPGMPSEPIFDSGGAYAIITNVCPLMYGNGNDWAIWASDRYPPKR